MILAVLLSLLVFEARPAEPLELLQSAASADAQKDDVDAEIRAAGEDVAALLALAAKYEEASQTAFAKRAYERVIEVEPDNEDARKALRHTRYDGQWFESYVKLAKYKREEDARMKKQGLVRFNDQWVAEADLPYARMGWVRDAQEAWVHPADLAAAREVEEWTAAGYKFRPDDSSWVAPADFQKWADVLWKCGDEWLDTKAADAFHANPVTPWELTGEHFSVITTCPWNTANLARWHADQTHAELVRLFGVAPKTPPAFLVLNSLDQYNAAAAGVMIDAEGLSSLSGAYFSDGALDPRQAPLRFAGTGVSYWEGGDSKIASWGPLWARWAAAQSFVEAIDPSWEAVSERVAGNGQGDLAAYGVKFWSEKAIPRWLRYGAASYAERFMRNPLSGEGADPWDLRTFAFTELKKSGGLHKKLADVFAFELTLEDIPASTQLYSEAGLIVAFLLDGAADDKDLHEKHEALRAALASGSKDDVRAAAKKLESVLAKRSKAINAFAGL